MTQGNMTLVELKKRLLGQAIQISPAIADSLEIIGPRTAGLLEQFLTVGVTAFLWGEDVGETTIEWPANAWEHLKKHLGLAYRCEVKTIYFRAYYPDFVHHEKLGRCVLRIDG